MKNKRARLANSVANYLANFEAHSVMLIAACALGGAASLHAQTTPAAPATAAPASEDAAAAFERADTNKDGKLSKAEAQAIPSVAQRFDQIDTDGDGTISRAEYDKATNS